MKAALLGGLLMAARIHLTLLRSHYEGPHFWSRDPGEGVLMPQQSWEHPLFLPIPPAETMYTPALWH